MGATLVELRIGDEPAAWGRAGFAVAGDVVRVGSVQLRLVGESEGRGILSWALDGVTDAEVDGLPAHDAPAAGDAHGANPNGVRALDHVVVTSPDLDRTIDALVATGLELRRVRDLGTRQQAFFWLGEPILELVGPKEPSGTGPSRFWGVACTVDDIDATAASLGDACGDPKDAVQPGRRIATLRHEPLGMSVPVAFMTPHVRSGR